MTKNETKWEYNYLKLYEYIQIHKQFPDKKKEEQRGLLNWWKYNKRLIKSKNIDNVRLQRLIALSEMRLKRQPSSHIALSPTDNHLSEDIDGDIL